MMRRFGLLFGIALVISFGAALVISSWWPPKEDQGPPREANDRPLPEAQSQVIAPIALDLCLVKKKLREIIPNPIASINEGKENCVRVWGVGLADCHIEGTATLDGSLSLTGQGQSVTVRVPIKVAATVRGRGEAGKNVRESGQASFVISATITPDLTPDWQVTMQVQPEMRWNQRPTAVVFGVPITFGSAVEPKIRKFLGDLAARMPELLAELKFREKVEQGWKQAHSSIPIHTDPPVWLTLKPSAVGFSGLNIENDMVNTRLMTSGVVAIHLGPQPAAGEVSALPSLTRDLPKDDHFAFVVPVTLPYKNLENVAQETLTGKTWNFTQLGRNGSLTVKEVKIYPSGERLVVGLNLTADLPNHWFDTQGWVYALGQLAVNNETRTVSVQQFDFTASTDNKAVNALVEVLRLEPIRERLEKSLTYSYKDDYDTAMKKAQEAINRDLGNEIRMAGRIKNGSVEQIDVVPEGLRLLVKMNGIVMVGSGEMLEIEAEATNEDQSQSSFGGIGYSYGTCLELNPYSKHPCDRCECPKGYKRLDVTSGDDRGFGGGFIVCYKDKPTDFGGMSYALGNECIVRNPFTNDCTCPENFTRQDITGHGEKIGFEGGFQVCYGSQDLDFGGMFYSYGDGVGRVCIGNPWTKDCSCPPGYDRRQTISGKDRKFGFEGGLEVCYRPRS